MVEGSKFLSWKSKQAFSNVRLKRYYWDYCGKKLQAPDMAIIRQNPTATRHKIAQSSGEKVKVHKTRIARSVLASKINEKQKSRLMRKSARAKDNLRTRNVTKQRDQRKVPRSQMMYWLNQKGDTAQDKTFFLPPPRRLCFTKERNP